MTVSDSWVRVHVRTAYTPAHCEPCFLCGNPMRFVAPDKEDLHVGGFHLNLQCRHTFAIEFCGLRKSVCGEDCCKYLVALIALNTTFYTLDGFPDGVGPSFVLRLKGTPEPLTPGWGRRHGNGMQTEYMWHLYQ